MMYSYIGDRVATQAVVKSITMEAEGLVSKGRQTCVALENKGKAGKHERLVSPLGPH